MRKFVVYSGNNPEVIRDALVKRGNWEQIPETAKDAINNANFIWRPCNYGILGYSKLDETLRKNKDLVQVFNHFPDNTGMCTKTGLIKSLKQYYAGNDEARAAKYYIWETTPTSFLISAGCEDTEYNNFVARVRDLSKKLFQRESVPAKHCMENMWLVKPANLNQGRGIEVFRTLQGMLTFLALKSSNSQWVVQKYIEKPLLFYKRKFDIRVWVLITNKNEVFMYKHGYMRTSSSSYDTRDQNNYVHLTNNCLQKHGNNYGAFEEGNTLSYQVLQDYLRQQYPDYDVYLETHIISRFRDFIIDSYLAWKMNLHSTKRRNVFELFGYDFLIDEDLRVWLIEVNTNPYLGVPNPFIADLLPKMVDDMFEIVLDPIFPPKNPVRQDGRPNDFELIYCESGSNYSSKPINLRSSFRKSVYPIQELETMTQIINSLPQQEIKAVLENEDSLAKKIVSASVDLNRFKTSAHPNLSLQAIIKNMQSPLLFRSALDTHFLKMQVKVVLSRLSDWKQLDPMDIELACRALITISNSPAVILLVEDKKILILTELLSDREVKPEIKLAIIETLNMLIKDLSIKKKILCNKIIHDLINIILLSCDEKECKVEALELRLSALRCLVNLGRMNVKKLYVPGENKELEKMRNFFIAQGGMMALLVLSRNAVEEDVRKIAEKAFDLSVDSFDWEKQASVLRLLQEYHDEKKTVLITNFVKGYSDQAEDSKSNRTSIDYCIFYKSRDPGTNKAKKANASVSYPQSLLQMSSLSEMIEMVKNILKKFKIKSPVFNKIKEAQSGRQLKSPEPQRSKYNASPIRKDKEIRDLDHRDRRTGSRQRTEKRVMSAKQPVEVQPQNRVIKEYEKFKKREPLLKQKKMTNEKKQSLRPSTAKTHEKERIKAPTQPVSVDITPKATKNIIKAFFKKEPESAQKTSLTTSNGGNAFSGFDSKTFLQKKTELDQK